MMSQWLIWQVYKGAKTRSIGYVYANNDDSYRLCVNRLRGWLYYRISSISNVMLSCPEALYICILPRVRSRYAHAYLGVQ